MDNNMRFNQMLNTHPYGREIYNMLWQIASKPSVQQAANAEEKRKAIAAEILAAIALKNMEVTNG